MPNSLMMVFTSATSEQDEAAFNEWYNTKHLHDIAALDGVVAATRYRIAGDVRAVPDMPSDDRGYVAVYELKAASEDELRALTQSLQAALGEGRVDLSPTLHLESASAVFALPISERVTA